MFGKKPIRELEPPPIAKSNPQAAEVLRVWMVPNQEQQVALKTAWQDPAAWGLLLADIARHVVKAYANEGQNPDEVIKRIRMLWDAEFANPTDMPIQISKS